MTDASDPDRDGLTAAQKGKGPETAEAVTAPEELAATKSEKESTKDGDGTDNKEEEEEDEEDNDEDDEDDDDDEEDDDDDDEDDDDEDDDEEPRLKYARLTQHLGPIYRNGDATSAFLVAGDKMVRLPVECISMSQLTMTRS